jgi:hypothetical protein
MLYSDGDYLGWEAEEEVVQVSISASEYAYEVDQSPCKHVDAMLVDNAANRKLCQAFLDLPIDATNQVCDSKVPKTVYSVSATDEMSLNQLGVKAVNTDYEFVHFGDASASDFIRANCGDEVADAYSCLAPSAYRADLFRFCALNAKGGVYLDADLLPLVKLEELYDPCASATVGHDFPQGRPQKQMKILAGEAGAPLFQCMLHKIVDNVRERFYPDNPLALTGPMVLEECYADHSENVSVTYRDTRNAAYPYTGMSGNDQLLAFEVPSDTKVSAYHQDFYEHEIYRSTCPLHNAHHVKVVASASV